MSNFQVGSKILGGDGTSTANLELVVPLAGWTDFGYYKFSFYNVQDCHVKINGGDPILVRAGQGVSTDVNDVRIESFVIVEAAISYNWVGGC